MPTMTTSEPSTSGTPSTDASPGEETGEETLFQLISDRSWDLAAARAKLRPEEAGHWAGILVNGPDGARRKGGGGSGSGGATTSATTTDTPGTADDSIWSQCLPLHRAAALDSPAETIDALIVAHPDALCERDTYWGRLPLHFACLSGASFDAVQPLLQKYPHGARVVAIHDRLPIHYACGGNAPERVVLALLKVNPRTAQRRDAYGWLPLHWAAAFHKSDAVIAAIIEAYPEGLHKQTNRGATPTRCARSSQQRETVEDAIELAASRGVDVEPPQSYHETDLNDEYSDRPRRRQSTESLGSLGQLGPRRRGSSGSLAKLGNASLGSIGSVQQMVGEMIPFGRRRSSIKKQLDIPGGGDSGHGSRGRRKSSSAMDQQRRRRRSGSVEALRAVLGKLTKDDIVDDDESLDSDEAEALVPLEVEFPDSPRKVEVPDSPPVSPRSSSCKVDEDAKETVDEDAKETAVVEDAPVRPRRGRRMSGTELSARTRSRSVGSQDALEDLVGDVDNETQEGQGSKAPRRRRRARSIDPSEYAAENNVEYTSRAAADQCKEGVARESRRTQRDDGDSKQRRRRSKSIDALNRVIKAVGIKDLEIVETDPEEKLEMERKSSVTSLA